MCLSIPGKIISIEKSKFIIDYGQEKRVASASAVDVKLGDYVIVSNKIIINKINEKEAEELIKLLK